MSTPDKEIGVGVKLTGIQKMVAELKSALSDIGHLTTKASEALGPIMGGKPGGPGGAQVAKSFDAQIKYNRESFATLKRDTEKGWKELAAITQKHLRDAAWSAQQHYNTLKTRSQQSAFMASPEYKAIARGFPGTMETEVTRIVAEKIAADKAMLADAHSTIGVGGGRGGGQTRGWFRRFAFGGGRGSGGAGFRGDSPAGLLGGFASGLGIPLGVGGAMAFGMYQARKAANQSMTEYDLARNFGSADTLARGSNATGFGNLYRDPFMSPTEAVGVGHTFGRLAGMGGRSEREQAEMAMSAGRFGIGLGIGAEGGASVFGEAGKLGVTRNTAEQKKFAIEIGEAIVNARMRGREPEMIESVMGFIQMGMRTMSSVSGDAAISMAMRLAMANPGSASAQGALGAQTLAAAHGAIVGADLFPGMNLPMSPFLMGAMQNMGVTGMDEMTKLKEQGIFGEKNGKYTMTELFKQISGMPDTMQAKIAGLPFDKMQELRRAAMSPGWGTLTSGLTQEQKTAIGNDPHKLSGMMALMQKGTDFRTPEGAAALSAMMKATPTEEEQKKAEIEIANNLNKAFQELQGAVLLATRALGAMTEILVPIFGLTRKSIGSEGYGKPLADILSPVPGGKFGGIKIPFGGGGTFEKMPKDVQAAIQAAASRTGVDKDYMASIWTAEGGSKAKWAFGMEQGADLGAKANLVANTVQNNMLRYQQATGKSPTDPETGRYTQEFTKFLGARYAPLNDARDTGGLNKNWPGNVTEAYTGAAMGPSANQGRAFGSMAMPFNPKDYSFSFMGPAELLITVDHAGERATHRANIPVTQTKTPWGD